MNPSNASSKRTAQEIQRDDWNAFLAEFTREYRGAHAVLEVTGSDVGYQVETENRQFDGIAADVKDGEQVVWIHFVSTPDEQHTHGIHNVMRIFVAAPTEKYGAAVEVETKDGTRTVLELSRPEDYALPSGEQQTRPA